VSSTSTIKVFVPQQLRNYTGGATQVSASGATVDEALTHLNQRYPGLRFRVVDEQGRIREHMRIFVDGERVQEVAAKLKVAAEMHIFGALSGG
jgi:molybdopterin converting factor small subunit